jgi:branched-chain amino acid transport system substrate-binding protein
MRDAIQATKIDTMQGTISFDNNGDLTSRIISVFQIKHTASFPQDDMVHQYKYVGVAPQDAGV